MKKIYKFLICAVVIFSLTALPSFAEVVEDNRYNYVYTVTQTETAEVGVDTYFYFDLPFGMYVSHHIVTFTFPSLVSGYGDILFEGYGVEAFEADGNGTEIRNTACGVAMWLSADTLREVTVTVTTYMVGTYADGYNEGHEAGFKVYGDAVFNVLLLSGYNPDKALTLMQVGDPAEVLEIILNYKGDVMHGIGWDEGYLAGEDAGYIKGYDEGYQDSYKDLYDQLHSGIKDTMDKAENSIDEKANGSFIQGFLAGMWNGVTAFISMILEGVTFSGLKLINIVATALGILIAVFVIKMVKG